MVKPNRSLRGSGAQLEVDGWGVGGDLGFLLGCS